MDPCLFDLSASIRTASDVYSFGIMAWQVLSGLKPYMVEITAAAPASALEAATLLKALVGGPRGMRPPVAALVEHGVPPAVVALVEACWAPSQTDRPAMAVVERVLEEASAALARAPAAPAAPLASAPVPVPASAIVPAVSALASPAAPAPSTSAPAPPTAEAPVPAPTMPSTASSSSGAGDDISSITLKYEDVSWDRDRRGDKVMIGRGASGIVYAGVLHRQPVAIKSEVLRAGEEETWLRAVRLHVRATSPHIVATRGIIVDCEDNKVTHYIVMERLAGTMTELLLTRAGAHYGANMALCLQLLADVASGLAYLHSFGIIHADVKPDNVLLTLATLPAAKLADLGSSVLRREGTKTRDTLRGERGTLLYMDPCLFDPNIRIQTASDVYSFGVMAWQVLSGLQPYEALLMAATATTNDATTAMQRERLLKAHVCGPHGKRPPVAALVERGLPPAVVTLVASCWSPAQADRPTMVEVQRALAVASAALARAPTAPAAPLASAPAPVPVVSVLAPAPAPSTSVPTPAVPPTAEAPVPASAVPSTASSGGGGSGAGYDMSSITLKYEDVAWDRDRRGDKVLIGRGAFGIVYAGVLHGQPVAIKSEMLHPGAEEEWLRAVRLHVWSTSRHIVAARGIIVDRENNTVTHYIVMERLAGTMTQLLLTPGGAHYGADVALRLQLLADVAGGLAYLHSFSIIHADVKPDNVLLTSATLPVAKLADFGSSVLRREGTKTHDTLMGERGTIIYMDPRLLDPAASITTAIDVYSFGIMAWQVLSGCVPYEAEVMATLPPTTTEPQMAAALRRHVMDGGCPPAEALSERGVPPDVVSLVVSCWAPEQAARPAMADVQRVLAAASAAL